MLVAAVDIGSSSARCSVFRFGGREEVALPKVLRGTEAQVKYTADEIDAMNLSEAVEQVIEESLAKLEKNAKVDHLALSCFVMNMLGVNKKFAPLSHIFSYAASGEKVMEASRDLKKEAEISGILQKLHKATGTAFYHSSYLASQLRALGGAPKSLWKMTTIPSFLLQRWTTASDLSAISISEASWTGMLNIETLDWNQDVLKLLPKQFSESLPKVESKHSKVLQGVKLKPDFLKKWPALAKCKFHLGIADGLAANIGSMCVTSGKMAVTIGTSAAVRILLSRDDVQIGSPSFPPDGLWCYCVDENRILLGGALTDGGSIYKWAKTNLKLEDADDDKAEKMEPGSGGITVMPFLRGERSMGWHDSASLSIHGVAASSTPAEILRACMEGVGIRLALVIEAITSSFRDHNKPDIICSGAALSNSKLLQSILSDATNHVLYTSHWAADEATSTGVAMFAFEDAEDYFLKVSKETESEIEVQHSPSHERHLKFINAVIPRHMEIYEQLFGHV